MATKIKVKKITDLTKIVAEQGTDLDDSKVILSGDQLVVAHKTNVDDAGGGIMHSTAMEVQELLKYISKQLENKYMTLEAGGQLSSLVESKLQEAEDNMAKGNDVYSSNYFMDDSGKTTFGGGDPIVDDNNISSWITGAYIFKSTCTANVHLTIYNTSNSTATAPVATVTKPGQAYAKIQMLTKSGDWKTICQEPLQCADGAFDIDLHGYFFAGTQIRGLVEQHLAGTNYVNFNMSNMQVTRFSSDKGFDEFSFDWWVSNNNMLSSNTAAPQAISAPGFLSFSGLYWSDTRDGANATNTIVGSKNTDFIVNKRFDRHYCMNAVYANVKYQDGVPYRLGCTEKDNIIYDKNSGITDDFSGKYYYINPSSTNPASAFTTTDFKFKDDVKGGKADSGGGWHNATLIKYTDYREISSVVGTYVSTDSETGITSTVSVEVYTLDELTAKYNNTTAAGYKPPHKFYFSGGYGYNLSVDANNCTNFYPYVGTDQRNIASLEIKQYDSRADGRPVAGCYVKEDQTSWIGSGGAEGVPPPAKYALLPTSLGPQRIRSVIRDDDPAKWTDIDDRWFTPVEYRIEVLNENVERIGVGKNLANYDLKFTPVSSYPAVNNAIDKWLTAEISAGWPLTSATLAAPDSATPLTLNDFAFASCPRLEEFEFPSNTGATGVYTFAAPSQSVKYVEIGGVYGNNKISVITPKAGTPNMSQLTSVTFHHSTGAADPCTHIDGYNGHPGETVAMFSNCQNLAQVNLEDTDIQTLGSYSFWNCKQLPKIEIPQTCTGLGASVFEGCSSLVDITFPSTLSNFKTQLKVGTTTGTDFKLAAPQMITKNTNTATLGKTGYKYKLAAPGGDNYKISIKLSKKQADYALPSGATLDDYRAAIFPEISALVNYLNTQGLGATTATTFTVKSNQVTSLKYGAGRRYYIIDKDGKYVNLGGTAQSDHTNQNNLTFNTVATQDKVPVANMIVPYAVEGDSTWQNKDPAEAYCVPVC